MTHALTCEQIARATLGEPTKRAGSELLWHCPNHEDRHESLSINPTKKVFLCGPCNASGTPWQFAAFLARLDPGDKAGVTAWLKERGLLNDKRTTKSANGPGTRIAEYVYRDASGSRIARKLRYEPKSFSWQRYKNEQWIDGLGGVKTPLYRLPEIQHEEFVVLTEGEKDADAGAKIGLPTTTSGGTGSFRDDHADALHGKTVVVVVHADSAGRQEAQKRAVMLCGKVESLKVVELPGAKDLSDWIAGGGNRDALLGFIEMQSEWKQPEDRSQLGSFSTAELFTVQDAEIEWLAWPFAAKGLATITDALPKVGKTIFFLQGILASRANRPFLGSPTKPMRIVYVSEQSAASLAVQVREVGFLGSEPVNELRWVPREFWSRFVFTEFLERLERQFLCDGSYNTLIFDCWHTVARLEDENAAAEVNRLGNLTIDVAARNKLALALGRHDRKSGGEVGLSGRSSIQLSGLVDVILHLVRVSGSDIQRRLEILGRVPGLPGEQVIELVDGVYINRGAPKTVLDETGERIKRVGEWLDEFPGLTAEDIVSRFARLMPPVEISLATAKRYRAKAR